ncbi:MAG: hypothetical protein AAF665_12460 [Pseudomonadota bacterium]
MRYLTHKSKIALCIGVGATALTACAPESGVGQFYREAGIQLDQGEFGNATLHNQLVQTCATNGFGGGKVSGKAGDPVVVLDPESTPTRKVYRVHCDGDLDGKYASVIYRQYVGSSTQAQSVESADGE